MKRACAWTPFFAASVAAAPFVAAQSDHIKGMDMKGMDVKGMEMKKGDGDERPHKGIGVVKSTDSRKGTVTIAHGAVYGLPFHHARRTSDGAEPCAGLEPQGGNGRRQLLLSMFVIPAAYYLMRRRRA